MARLVQWLVANGDLMGRDIYPAMSGGMRAMRQLEVVSNNLANVNTAGFKADRPSFTLHRTAGASQDGAEGRLAGAYASMGGAHTDWQQGVLRDTGAQTDLALVGQDGFFRLQAGPEEAADSYLTRDGSFVVDGDGYLTARSGHRVLDDGGGPINVGAAGFEVNEQGHVLVDGGKTATVGIFDVADRTLLSKVGGNRFSVQVGTEVVTANAEVVQGSLESSNVEPVRALTELIALSRYYQAFQRNLQTSSELDQALSNRVGKIDQ